MVQSAVVRATPVQTVTTLIDRHRGQQARDRPHVAMHAHVSPPRVRAVHRDWLFVYLGVATATCVDIAHTRESHSHTSVANHTTEAQSTQGVTGNRVATQGVHAGGGDTSRTSLHVPQPAAFWRFQVSEGCYRDIGMHREREREKENGMAWHGLHGRHLRITPPNIPKCTIHLSHKHLIV